MEVLPTALTPAPLSCIQSQCLELETEPIRFNREAGNAGFQLEGIETEITTPGLLGLFK